MSKKVVFYCNANEKTGLGHLSRCLNLARELKKNDLEIVFLGNFSILATNFIQNYCFKYINIESLEPKFELYFTDLEIVIIDSYQINQNFIEQTCTRNYKVVFIDDFNNFDFSLADLIINFTINAIHLNYSCSKTCLGTSFFLNKPEFIEIRSKNIIQRSIKTENLLIFLSKANLQKELINSLLVKIEKVFSDKFENIYFLSDERTDSLNNKIQLLKPNFEIEKYYQKADLIICGGGLTKYEAAYCCIPNATIAITSEQKKETEFFAAHNLTYDLGIYSDEPSVIQEKISNFAQLFLNNQYYQTYKQSSQKYFNSNSLKDVSDRVLELLDK